MIEFEYVIKDEIGIHARPAGLLAKKAKEAGCSVMISKAGKKADATRLMAVMQLGVKKGDTIVVSVDTEDETIANGIKEFLEANL